MVKLEEIRRKFNMYETVDGRVSKIGLDLEPEKEEPVVFTAPVKTKWYRSRFMGLTAFIPLFGLIIGVNVEEQNRTKELAEQIGLTQLIEGDKVKLILGRDEGSVCELVRKVDSYSCNSLYDAVCTTGSGKKTMLIDAMNAVPMGETKERLREEYERSKQN